MDGEEISTAGMRITYAQNWSAYNKAQTNEGELFMKLLSGLCENVEQQQYKFGRPTIPMSDMVFATALKVYSTFSLRRFSTAGASVSHGLRPASSGRIALTHDAAARSARFAQGL